MSAQQTINPWDEPLPFEDTWPEDDGPVEDPAFLAAQEARRHAIPVDLAGAELVPVVSADLLRLSDPHALADIVRGLRSELKARLYAIAQDAKRERGSTGRPSASWLVPEATAFASAREVLDSLSGVLGEMRKLADGLAVDAMTDVLGEGRRMVRVATPDGGEVEVTNSPRTETSVNEVEVLDILGTHLSAKVGNDPSVPAEDLVAYTSGVRDGIAALRGLLGASPGWKVTALAQLVKELQGAGEGDLASRLDSAFARVEKGEPTPKVTVRYPDAV